jgi:invasion protein IalB
MAIGLRLALAMLTALAASGALAETAGGNSSAAKTKAPEAPVLKEAPPPAAAAPEPQAKVAGSYGSWTLLCGKEGEGKEAKERCSLVMPLVEKDTQKLVFRVIVTYGPQKALVLRVDGPTGVALQRGVEFSPDTKKNYIMPFQTCLPMGCKALLLVSDDLKKELAASKQGAITVYALNGKAVQTITQFAGFAEGLAALDKHVAGN